MTLENAVREHSGLVYREAHRLRGFTQVAAIDFEDLVQVGFCGLVKGLQKFDPSKGFAISTYLVPTIRGEMLRYLRDNISSVRLPRLMTFTERTHVVNHSLHETVCDEEGNSVERIHSISSHDDLTEFEVSELLERAFDDRQRNVIRLRLEGYTQAEIGAEIGVNQVMVSRILAKIKRKLEGAMLA